MKPLYKSFTKPVAVLQICNTFGAALFSIEGDEAVIAWASDAGYYGYHRHKVGYTAAGRPFIRKGDLRLYLDEFIRI